MRIRTHTNPFNYFARMEPLDFKAIFPNFNNTFDFEVGFGRGLFMRHYGAMFPNRNLVGIEVRKSPVTLLKKKLEQEKLTNVYPIHGNAQICLEDQIPDTIIERCFVFHPDPWFKKRHQKRRVVNPTFLKTLAKKMKPEAKLYISTDVGPLWEAMKETVMESGLFDEIEDTSFWDTIYCTEWQLWSVKDQRQKWYGTFQRR
jgi:tRNA (guanine-N7-)-methyltransferase